MRSIKFGHPSNPIDDVTRLILNNQLAMMHGLHMLARRHPWDHDAAQAMSDIEQQRRHTVLTLQPRDVPPPPPPHDPIAGDLQR